MTTPQTIALLAQALAALTAFLLARRNREHVPAAIALGALVLANALGAPVAAALMPFSVEPWHGGTRVLVYLDGAFNLASYAPVAGLAVVVAVAPEHRRRMAIGIVGCWALASIVLAAL